MHGQQNIKILFSWKIFERYSSMKFRRNPSSGSRLVPWGRTDIHDQANIRFFEFCDRVSKLWEAVYLFSCGMLSVF